MEFDYSLLAKYLTGNISAEELSAIQSWAKSTERNASLWKEVIALRMKDNFDRFNTPEQIDKALSAIQERVGRKRFRLSFRTMGRYAAMFVLALGCALGYFVYESQQVEEYTLVVASGNPVKKVTLRDGSEVWLRSGTQMRIPKSFSPQNRSVAIEGEAFFSVKKDSVSPFVVRAEDLYVKVLGTSFNVKAYGEDPGIYTTLVEGRVAILHEGKAACELKPGEQSYYNKEVGNVTVREVETDVYTAWKDGMFYFKDMPLGEILKTVARWYDLEVFYVNAGVQGIQYSGKMPMYSSVEDVLRKFEISGDARFVLKGRTLTVYDR